MTLFFPIRQEKIQDKIHPLERLMLNKLYNMLIPQKQEQLPSLLETKEDDVLPFDTLESNYQEEPPPSKNYMQLQDVEEKHLHPGVDLDSNLISHMKTITKIDWQNDVPFEICNLLPLGEEWTYLSDLVGDGKYFHCFHHTGLLVYLMGNKKNFSSECLLTKVYKSYPPASWPHALMCANGCAYKFNREGRETLVSNVVYIAEAWFPEDKHELLNWISKQSDIIELTETVNASGKKCYVFQFALGYDMCYNY